MKLKIALLLITQVMITITSIAQTSLKMLKKGDYINGNMDLGKMINYRTKTAKISDFKGKLIILDFWNTHCVPCVAALPGLDSLQAKFKNQIAIIPVTIEPEEKISSFFKKKNISLASVVENRELEKLFPFHGVPFEVWINHNGKVIATTNGEDVNSENIGKYLNSGELDVKQRIDVLDVKFDMDEDLFVNGNGGTGHFLWRSILANKIEGLGGNYAVIKKPESKSKVNFSANAYLLYCEVLYMDVRCNNPGLFFIESEKGEVKALGQNNIRNATDFFYKNISPEKTYCYNLVVPPTVSDSILYRKYMLEDLNRYFNLDVRIEKRKVPSWTLIKANNGISPLALKSDTCISMIVLDDDVEGNYYEKVQNMTLNGFLGVLKTWWSMIPPIFNETGYTNEKVNLNGLHLKYRKDDAYHNPLILEEWRAALQRNGLDIKVEDREVEVMVFKKKDTPSK